MARYTIVVDRPSDWKWSSEGFQVLTAEEFLTRSHPQPAGPGRIINLCRRYRYLSAGYYCSLLAEARRELPIPTVSCILDLSSKSVYNFALPDLEHTLAQTIRRLDDPPEAPFTLTVFFGHPDDTRFRRLAKEVFELFRYPAVRLRLVKNSRWRVQSIRPVGIHKIVAEQGGLFESALRAYTRATGRTTPGWRPSHYDLAILYNPAEKLPPSNAGALERFIRAGQALRMDIELIRAKDLDRVAEFDALFIRETTALDDHTFRFARKAETEGIPVIDDTASILRCANKVFMAEMLAQAGLPTPKTMAIERRALDRQGIESLEQHFEYPIVLKIPDGSFSRGIFKAENRLQLVDYAERLLKRSRLVLAQEFMYTAYDWRVGVLNGEPLFACQYMMSRNHWQIVNHRSDGSFVAGGFETFAVENAPAEVVAIATRAASLIGDGLYGIDLKQNDKGIFIIEINDNPNVDHGIEDRVLRGELYTRILKEFIRRIDAPRRI